MPQRRCFWDVDNLPLQGHPALLGAYSTWAGSDSTMVVAVGKNATALEALRKSLGVQRPHDSCELVKVGARKQEADVILALRLGLWLANDKSGTSGSLVVSDDKALSAAIVAAARAGFKVDLCSQREPTLPSEVRPLITWVDPGAPEGRGRGKHPAAQDLTSPNFVFDDACAGSGLWCIKAPNPDTSLPVFLPFPDGRQTVTIGARHCDISLLAWEQRAQVRDSIYSPHVTMTYQAGAERGWRLSCMRGMRRGPRQVAVRGRECSAASGVVTLASGDAVILGRFHLRFQAHVIDDMTSFEEPAFVVAEIEAALAQLARLVIGQRDSSTTPVTIVTEAYLKDYEALLTEHWDHPLLQQLARTFTSKNKLREALGRLVRLRNIAMHPSRGAMIAADRRKLAELHVIMCSAGVVQGVPENKLARD